MKEASVQTVPCPICGQSCSCNLYEGKIPLYNCPVCHQFELADEEIPYIQEIKSTLAGYLYETYLERKDPILINGDTIPKILSDPHIPKTAMQKLDKIILTMYRSGGDFTHINFWEKTPPAMGYARNLKELFSMMGALDDLGYVKSRKVMYGMNSEYPSHAEYMLTIQGLTYAESLLTTNINSTKIFVAMKFSDELFSIRDAAIKPACEACGFTAFTVNEEEHNDDITDKIISGIKTSRFIIADFTYNNLGVYYEAGYAKGLGRIVIKTCKKDWFEETDANGLRKNQLHFDIAHDNLILWKDADDLRELLEARIRATIL
ncbi:hypothetical protein [Methanorbis furvi]|uniref:Uncharacterized protein n=1 Tax=Methanorbis furvi TaxID=3028299 RepID=A0AAE4MBB1_9EURY|nr:hypothetical protein [Methanocorpusculaceae archaeon Ag1]